MSQPPSTDHPNRLSELTTPTWEMELLISGATVFGLLQLPGELDAVFYPAIHGNPELLSQLYWLAWIYSRVTAMTLVVTFILHLCLRGYWVALVGLHSLYPRGIQWDRTRLGPHARDVARKLGGDTPSKIEAADNRATRVFGVGFGLAMLMAAPVILAAVALGIAFVAERMDFSPDQARLAIGGLMALVLGPMLLAMFVDRRIGSRISETSFIGRTLRAILSAYSRLGLGNSRNTIVLLFTSNEKLASGRIPLLGALGAVLIVVSLQFASGQTATSIGHYRGLPSERPDQERVVATQYYASLRGNDPRAAPVPVIPDLLVSDPYLRLFLPYRPRLHDAAMQRDCPGAFGDDASPAAAMACLARLEPIFLDGQRITVAFDASTDSTTGQRGMLAMIPLGTLNPGRHELQIWLPSRVGAPAPRQPTYRIPFWK